MGEGNTLDELALTTLRGSLAASGNTARDLTTLAQTRCTRRRALAVVGAEMNDAAKRLGPLAPSKQSPFALQIGSRFEAQLRRDGAARLREALGDVVGIDAASLTVVDLDASCPWESSRPETRMTTAAARRAQTDGLLEACLRRAAKTAVLVLHPRFALTLGDTVRDVEPDAMLCLPEGARGEPQILLAEIKAFVDHGHRTDTHDLGTTRLQLAVYALALGQTAARLGLDMRPITDGLVVLRKPSSMFGSASLEPIHRDIDRLERAMRRAPTALGEILAGLPPGARLDDPQVLQALPTRYEPDYCLSNCALALQCRARSDDTGDPAFFGSPVREVCAGTPSLPRAHALATAAAEPATEAEADFSKRMRPLRARIDAARERCS